MAILDFQSEGFQLFFIYKSPWCFLLSLESVGFWVKEKKWKIGFQDGCHGGHLGFPTSMILAIFDLDVTLMLPTKFGVNWPFDWGEEVKTRFSRWRPSWISDWNAFSYFWSLILPTKYRVNWPRGVGVGFLKQLLTPHHTQRTLTDHNSSPWALPAQVS